VPAVFFRAGCWNSCDGPRATRRLGEAALLKAELKITSAQEPQWVKFTDAYRSVAKNDSDRLWQTMQGGPAEALAGVAGLGLFAGVPRWPSSEC